MVFSSPIWLTLLLPWSAVMVWMLIGRRPGVSVPFIELWTERVPIPPAGRRLSLPKTAVLLLLLSMLLGILAAARPIIAHPNHPLAAKATIILDRGLTMSSNRRDEAIASAIKLLGGGSGEVDLISIPDGSAIETTRSAWPALARATVPVAFNSRGALQRAVANALRRSDGPIIALSDQKLRADDRVTQIVPTSAAWDVAITKFAMRDSPAPAAMVRIENHSDLTRCGLLLQSGTSKVHVEINLPKSGAERNYFINLPAAGKTALAALEVHDDVPLDDVAWLVKTQPDARIEMDASVSPVVRQIVSAYRRARPGENDGPLVKVVSEESALRADEAGVVAMSPKTTMPPANVNVRAHPITRNLDPSRLRLAGDGKPNGPGWVVVISAGAQALVAVRDQPAREVWFGFDETDVARTPEFVVLWTNALDWVADQAAAVYSADVLPVMGRQWQPTDGDRDHPGIFRGRDGKIRAANAPPPDWSATITRSPAFGRSTLPQFTQAGGIQLSSPLALLAVICVTLAGLLFGGRGRRNLTAFSAARTFSDGTIFPGK